jgi:hypothetical protein
MHGEMGCSHILDGKNEGKILRRPKGLTANHPKKLSLLGNVTQGVGIGGLF